MSSGAGTIKLTVAQAIVRFLANQWIVQDLEDVIMQFQVLYYNKQTKCLFQNHGAIYKNINLIH